MMRNYHVQFGNEVFAARWALYFHLRSISPVAFKQQSGFVASLLRRGGCEAAPSFGDRSLSRSRVEQSRAEQGRTEQSKATTLFVSSLCCLWFFIFPLAFGGPALPSEGKAKQPSLLASHAGKGFFLLSSGELPSPFLKAGEQEERPAPLSSCFAPQEGKMKNKAKKRKTNEVLLK
jgi:hypothetical protein